MDLADAIEELDAFITGYRQARKKAPLARIELLIICPDCGKNPPFRNRCPKCGGDSWIPAGPVSGIFEWVKARQWRGVVGPPPPGAGRPPTTEPARVDNAKPDKRKRRRRKRSHQA